VIGFKLLDDALSVSLDGALALLDHSRAGAERTILGQIDFGSIG